MSTCTSSYGIGVSPIVHQLLHTPLTFVDGQLAQAAQAANDPKTLAEGEWGVEAGVEGILGLNLPRTSPLNHLGCIPSLNLLHDNTSQLKDGQLVRFRGMIQETFQPDYFTSVWTPKSGRKEQVKTAKYRDVIELDESLDSDAGTQTASERISANVVPIPGESEWVSAAIHKLEQQSGHSVPVAVSVPSSASAAPGSAKKKRALESDTDGAPVEEEKMDTTDSNGVATTDTVDVVMAPDQKKIRGEEAGAPAAASAAKYTGVEDHGLEVIVLFYDALAAARHPKVTQCYEFVGVLSINPDIANCMEDAGFDMGTDGFNPRRRKALRMHALYALPITVGFPFISDPKADQPLFTSQVEQMRPIVAGVRSSLVGFLTEMLGGDALAGEVLLLFLLQRIHNRGVGSGGTASVGKLSLNLIAPSLQGSTGEAQLANKIQQAFEMLTPRAKKIELNVTELNKRVWQPVKDYESDCLHSNLLHLSSPSCLLLDETRLTEGRLNPVGVANLQVLSKLLQNGQLQYDFKYQTLGFDVDWCILLLSAGGRTLLQQEGSTSGVDMALKLQPASAQVLYATGGVTQPTEEQLNYWRAYLLLARQNTFQIAQEMSKSIEDHFISLRQQRPKVTSESTLHLLLNLARLHSLSHLESGLSPERWQHVTQMYEQIHQRNN